VASFPTHHTNESHADPIEHHRSACPPLSLTESLSSNITADINEDHKRTKLATGHSPSVTNYHVNERHANPIEHRRSAGPPLSVTESQSSNITTDINNDAKRSERHANPVEHRRSAGPPLSITESQSSNITADIHKDDHTRPNLATLLATGDTEAPAIPYTARWRDLLTLTTAMADTLTHTNNDNATRVLYTYTKIGHWLTEARTSLGDNVHYDEPLFATLNLKRLTATHALCPAILVHAMPRNNSTRHATQ
jgi:hypothetical protein